MTMLSSKNSFKFESTFDMSVVPELRQLDKRPMPRDGHAAIVFFNSLIVFGGDRHRMPFNDLLILPLTTYL